MLLRRLTGGGGGVARWDSESLSDSEAGAFRFREVDARFGRPDAWAEASRESCARVGAAEIRVSYNIRPTDEFAYSFGASRDWNTNMVHDSWRSVCMLCPPSQCMRLVAGYAGRVQGTPRTPVGPEP